MRIGIAGVDGSHAEDFLRHFNSEARYGDRRVTAIWGGRPTLARRAGSCGSTTGSDAETGCGEDAAADEHHRPLPLGLVPQGFSTGLVGGRQLDLAPAGGGCCS